MKLCAFCDWFLHGRRWLILLAAPALCAALLLFLPGPLAVLLASPALLTAAMLPAYAQGVQRAFGAEYTRRPCPKDALAQTVLIDASLADGGLCLRHAAQPFAAANQLTLRLGSGALLLGTAMVITVDALPPADGAALLEAAAQLNIKPDRMRQRCPVLHRSTEDGVTRVTVQDGGHVRTYLTGNADAVTGLCQIIWDGQPRPMTDDDHIRLRDAAAAMTDDCRVYAFATCEGSEPPVFLGLASLGRCVRPQTLQEISALRAMGLTVMLRPDEAGETDLPALCRLLDLPVLHAQPDVYLSTGRDSDSPRCLTIRRLPGESLEQPLSWLRRSFSAIEWELTLLATLLATCLACCMGCGAAGAAVMTALWLGICPLIRPMQGRKPRWHMLAAAAFIALLSGLFLSAVLPGSGAPALLCLILAGMLVFTQYRDVCAAKTLAMLLLPLLPLAAATFLTAPVSPASALFAVVMGVLAGMPVLLGKR